MGSRYFHEKQFFFSDDLADAAQGSYGSSSRMLLEAASPFSSLLVELVDKKGLDEKIRGGGLNHRGNEGLPFDEMVPWPSWGTLWYEEALGSTGVANLGSEEIERAAAPLTSTSPCDIFTLDQPDCKLARDFCHYVALIIN